METWASFAEAKEHAGEEDQVCGVQTGPEEGCYFVLPQEASDDLIEATAFGIRHNRSMNDAEMWAKTMVATNTKMVMDPYGILDGS